MAGTLYCGDNLEVLEEYVPDESVDLIYLDPPFNSQRTYNIVYKGSRAQEEAFKDYWAWEEVAGIYTRLVESARVPPRLRKLLRALHELLIDDDADLLAYLTMMTPRLVALHQVLRPTGSLYLHCDPTASHYLKILLDALFQQNRFRNEVVWRRTNARSASEQWPRIHDILLVYGKSEKSKFTPLVVPASAAKMPHTLITKDGVKYNTYELTGAGIVKDGDTGKPWHGFDPGSLGRHWANSSKTMDAWDKKGLIHWPANGGWPRRRDERPFIPQQRTVTVGDVWDDIDRLNQTAKERVGFPTQKPLALLERIITASTSPGDLVLDPFCGCGTTIEACERLGRRWIGIDIAAKAVEVTEARFNRLELDPPEVVWHPVEPDAARKLAPNGKAFERWVLLKLRAARLRKHDRGIDGEAYFREPGGKTHHVVVSVKGVRRPNPAMVRELRGTFDREKATVGVLVLAAEPSREMLREATLAGHLPVNDAEGAIPRLQLVTLERLFSDVPAIRCPGVNCTEMPRKVVPTGQTQLSLDLSATQAANDRHPPEKPMPIRNARPRGASARKSAAK